MLWDIESTLIFKGQEGVRDVGLHLPLAHCINLGESSDISNIILHKI